jgi:hypothetical protein
MHQRKPPSEKLMEIKKYLQFCAKHRFNNLNQINFYCLFLLKISDSIVEYRVLGTRPFG